MIADERFWAKVEKSDTCWLWTGGKNQQGYGVFRYNGRSWRVHRLTYTWTFCPIPDGLDIDHRCHSRLCVRPDHLRLATNKQNGENRSGPNRNNRAGVRGVSWHSRDRRWVGCVTHNYKKYRQSFESKDAAEAWVTELRLSLFTHNDVDRVA